MQRHLSTGPFLIARLLRLHRSSEPEPPAWTLAAHLLSVPAPAPAPAPARALGGERGLAICRDSDRACLVEDDPAAAGDPDRVQVS